MEEKTVMANIPRSKTMNPRVPGVFHITTRCVRRAFLCGIDHYTGKDYSHRKQYLIARIKELAKYFAIAVGWEAILSNHLHLILANLPALAASFSDEEVIRRACKIFQWKFKDIAGVVNGEPTADQLITLTADAELVADMRLRLSDPSWFMKQLLQKLALMANMEDDCGGHFVEKRFKHRVITDERGLLICGIYVDLNELAARCAAEQDSLHGVDNQHDDGDVDAYEAAPEVDRPELSMNTSAGMRIAAKLLREEGDHAAAAEFDGHLMPISTQGDGQNYALAGSPEARRAQDEGMLEMPLDYYLQLLDEYGRASRPGKGTIDEVLPPILERLQLDRESLLAMINNYDTLFPNVVGGAKSLQEFSDSHEGLWSGQLASAIAAQSPVDNDKNDTGADEESDATSLTDAPPPSS